MTRNKYKTENPTTQMAHFTVRQKPKSRFCQRTDRAFGPQNGFFMYFDQLNF